MTHGARMNKSCHSFERAHDKEEAQCNYSMRLGGLSGGGSRAMLECNVHTYIFMCTYICVSLYVCIFVHVHIFIYICTYTYIYMHMYLCICVHVYIHLHIYIYVHIYAYICICMYVSTLAKNVNVLLHIYIQRAVTSAPSKPQAPPVLVCMYRYIHICIYLYTHVHICLYVTIYNRQKCKCMTQNI